MPFGVSRAAEPVFDIDIPAMNAAEALNRLAEQTGSVMLFSYDLAHARKANAVRGRYTLLDGLELLLRDTGLSGGLSDKRVVIIADEGNMPAGKEKTVKKRGLFASIFAVLAVHAATGVKADQESNSVLEEIVVTAQKREQSVQDVPMSVSVIGESTIEAAGIDNFTEYARMTPGLSFAAWAPGGGQFGDRNVFVRGISSSNTLGGGQPTAFYIGDTPMPFSDPNLFDVNRIEVLRGPQGTLYGSGSMGGTVKIVPNAPDLTGFSGKADSTVSSTHGGGFNYEARGVANIPVVEDRIAIRASAAYRHDEGYVDDANDSLLCATPGPACFDGVSSDDIEENVDDVETFTFRLASEIRLTDRLTLTPSVFGERRDIADRPNYVIGLEDGPDGLVTMGFGPASEERNDVTLYDISLNYDFGGADLTSSTSFLEWQKDNLLDISFFVQQGFGLPGPVPVGLATFVEHNIVTHESRIASSGENRIDWLVGVFFQREDFSFGNFSEAPSLPPGFQLLASSNNEVITEQLALFTEETLHLTDKWSVTAGLRYFRTDTSTERTVNASVFLGPDAFEQVDAPTEDGFTPKAEVTFEPNDDTLFYALAARGFRAGSANRDLTGFPGCTAELAGLGFTPASSFESDSLWNYEVGAKTQWADGRLTANLSAYHIEWDNIQQQIQLQCGVAFTANFGSAVSEGAELELRASPVDGLDLSLGVSYIDATLAEDSQTGNGREGDRVLTTPEWTVAFSAAYTVPLSFGYSAYVRGDYQYVGETAISFNTVGAPTDTATYQPSYEVAGFSVGMSNDVWDFSVFVENAFDERPQFDAGFESFGGPFPSAFTIRPRTIGATVRRQF